MRNRHRYGNLLGFVDICMNLLMTFITLFAFAFMLIKLQENLVKTEAHVDTRAKLVMQLSWDDASDDDVDLWARSSNPETFVSFIHRDSPNMFLDNDNLGAKSHTVKRADGTSMTTFGNREHVMIKDCTNTHITISVHYYHANNQPGVAARVELLSMDPFATLKTVEVRLDKAGQEQTAFQFDLDDACHVANISTAQSPWILQALPFSGRPGDATSGGSMIPPPPGPMRPPPAQSDPRENP